MSNLLKTGLVGKCIICLTGHQNVLLWNNMQKTGLKYYSDWVCTAVMSNDVMKDLRG